MPDPVAFFSMYHTVLSLDTSFSAIQHHHHYLPLTCKFLKDWDVVIITDTLPWTQAIFMSESINDKI